MRPRAWLLASTFTLFASTAAIFFAGPATAGTRAQVGLPPAPTSICPVGTFPILSGTYKGLCRTVNGVVFNPVTKQILYSPTPTPPPLPVNPLPGQQPPPTNPPGGGPTHSPGGSSGTPTHLISSSIANNPTYSTPYGKYFGSFGGGTNYFSPNGTQANSRCSASRAATSAVAAARIAVAVEVCSDMALRAG